MFYQELWFAWHPVKVATRQGQRWAWLETVLRECLTTDSGRGNWRFYAEK